jgi:hypothetical protein
MIPVPCWAFRYEADERGETGLLMTGMDYEDVHAMCDLEDDHDGEHVFKRQDTVRLVFK